MHVTHMASVTANRPQRDIFQSDVTVGAIVGRWVNRLSDQNRAHDEALSAAVNEMEQIHAAGRDPLPTEFTAWAQGLLSMVQGAEDVIWANSTAEDPPGSGPSVFLEVVQASPAGMGSVGFVAYSVRAAPDCIQVTSVRLPVSISGHAVARAMRRSEYDLASAVGVIAGSIPTLMAMSATGFMPRHIGVPAGRGMALGHSQSPEEVSGWRQLRVYQSSQELARNWEIGSGVFLGRDISPFVIKTYMDCSSLNKAPALMRATIDRWLASYRAEITAAFHEYAFPAGDAAQKPFVDARITSTRRWMLSEAAAVMKTPSFVFHTRKFEQPSAHC